MFGQKAYLSTDADSRSPYKAALLIRQTHTGAARSSPRARFPATPDARLLNRSVTEASATSNVAVGPRCWPLAIIEGYLGYSLVDGNPVGNGGSRSVLALASVPIAAGLARRRCCVSAGGFPGGRSSGQTVSHAHVLILPWRSEDCSRLHLAHHVPQSTRSFRGRGSTEHTYSASGCGSPTLSAR